MGWISHWGSSYYDDVMEQYGAAQRNNALIIYNYLLSKGFKRPAICAMLGNMMTESYLNPGQWQHGYSPYDGNKYNGMGLVGWTPYWRITDWLTSHGYDLNNADSFGYGMLDKLAEECFNPQEVTWISTNSYPLSFAQFAADESHDISWLANAFLYNYERPTTTPQPARTQQALRWSEILPGAVTFAPRLDSSGMQGSKYYYSDNPFYQSGYGLPNCTCYAYGRQYEIMDIKPTWLCLQDAKNWYPYAQSNTPQLCGSTPQLGAILCTYYSNGGHVAVVEQINADGSIVTSNSGYGSGIYFWTETLTPPYLASWAPSGAYIQGFIYLKESVGPPPTTGVKLLRWIPM